MKHEQNVVSICPFIQTEQYTSSRLENGREKPFYKASNV